MFSVWIIALFTSVFGVNYWVTLSVFSAIQPQDRKQSLSFSGVTLQRISYRRIKNPPSCTVHDINETWYRWTAESERTQA